MREGFTYTRREFLKKAGLAGGAMVMANVAGGIPSAAAATSKGQSAVDELLKGVCDIHIHAAPDVRERCINEFDFACKAKDLGYRPSCTSRTNGAVTTGPISYARPCRISKCSAASA